MPYISLRDFDPPPMNWDVPDLTVTEFAVGGRSYRCTVPRACRFGHKLAEAWHFHRELEKWLAAKMALFAFNPMVKIAITNHATKAVQ